MEWDIQKTNTQEMLLVLLYMNGVGHSKNKHTRDVASCLLLSYLFNLILNFKDGLLSNLLHVCFVYCLYMYISVGFKSSLELVL